MSDLFSVWAPAAQHVTLVVRAGDADARYVLDAHADGWWRPREPLATDHRLALESGDARYGFLVDGDGPYPDPRSRRQPEGVHELGAVFDPGEFSWSDAAWRGRELTGCVIYELHLGTFTDAGTLDAASESLDHLVALGVDAVELLPVNAFDGTWGWGYDGVLWFAVHEPYGGPSAYQRFVDACHERGIAVIQDVVYNHLGPSGNYLPRFGPYLGAGAGPWGDTVNLDGPHSDEVRRYILDNVAYWFREMHVDGLRLDAVHALHDSRATHLLDEIAAHADALSGELGRPLGLIAESDLNDPKLIRARERHGYGLTAQWDDDVHHAVHANVTGETGGYYSDFAGLGALAKVFERGWFHDGTWSSFRQRHHGRPLPRDISFSRLVAFAQDHDQIGNRAAGERLGVLVGDGSLAAAAAIVLLGPFTPMLFMGEEWGARTPWQFFTSHPDPELAEATAKGRIAEFARMGWDPASVPDPQDPRTFERSHLDWSEPSRAPHAELLGLYTRLIALRHGIPADTPASGIHADDERGVFAFTRGGLRVVAALRDADASLRAPGKPVLTYGAAGWADGSVHITGPGVVVVREG